MDKKQRSSGEGMGANQGGGKSSKEESKKNEKKKWTNKPKASTDDRQVLIKVGGLEYKEPGKRQRLVLASVVLGGNLLLVLATLLYFYNPAFKDFISTVGK